MRKVLIGVAVAAVLGGCAALYKSQASNTYNNLPFRKAVLTAVRSVRDCGYSLRSSSSPAEGITVINAVGPGSLFNQTVEITITVFDGGNDTVTVDAYASINNTLNERGVLSLATSRFYSTFANKMSEP